MRRKCPPFLPARDTAEGNEVLGTTKAIMQPRGGHLWKAADDTGKRANESGSILTLLSCRCL